jgi:hypothetical protein
MLQTNAPPDRTIPVMLDMGVCMSEGERERRRRFDELFGSYSSDIVAYCSRS